MDDKLLERIQARNKNLDVGKAVASFKAKTLLLLSLLLLILGIVSGFFIELNLPFSLGFGFGTTIDLLLLVLALFVLALPFNGYLTPFAFLLIGVLKGEEIITTPIKALELLPLLLSFYAGILLSGFIWEEEKPISLRIQKPLILLVLSLIIAFFIIEYLQVFLVNNLL